MKSARFAVQALKTAQGPEAQRLIEFTREHALDIIVMSKEFKKLIHPEKTLVLAPGRSPYFHSIALEEMGVKLFNFAFSGRAYSYSGLTRAQLVSYRSYLSGVGITPNLLYNDFDQLAVIDKISSGFTLKSLIYLFSHWQYENMNNTSLEIDKWQTNGAESNEYKVLANKMKAYRLPDSIFVSSSNHPCQIIELPPGNDKLHTCSYLAANSFPTLLPFYPHRSWETPPDQLNDWDHEYYLKACSATDLMRRLAKESLLISPATLSIFPKQQRGDKMFRHTSTTSQLDIGGLDKAKVLVELFNNAKRSQWTQATVGNTMCPDKFVRDMLAHIYQPRIDAAINELSFSEQEAEALLNKSLKVEYIGAVLIRIDFSQDKIDTSKYDQDHHGNGGAELAERVISALRQRDTNTCRM